jgi:hypothetical protein
MEELLIFAWHLFISLFGAILWNFGLFRNAKNKAEKENLILDWSIYKRGHWEDWIWSILCALPLVWFMKDFIHLMNVYYELPEYEGYYLLAGPLSMAIGYGINWVINKFDQ